MTLIAPQKSQMPLPRRSETPFTHAKNKQNRPVNVPNWVVVTVVKPIVAKDRTSRINAETRTMVYLYLPFPSIDDAWTAQRPCYTSPGNFGWVVSKKLFFLHGSYI